jgi:hypothetical protein
MERLQLAESKLGLHPHRLLDFSFYHLKFVLSLGECKFHGHGFVLLCNTVNHSMSLMFFYRLGVEGP